MNRELRTWDLDAVEVRSNEDGSLTLVGHAALFDTLSKPIGGAFRERIERGAFRRAIEEGQDVRALIDHAPSQIIGRTKSGTLRLAEDDRGLAVEIDLGNTQRAQDLAEDIRRGDIDQMSFGFRVPRGGERWERRASPEGLDVRTLLDVDLFDVSPVTYAAYEETSVAVRSHEAFASSEIREDPVESVIVRAIDGDTRAFDGRRGTDLRHGERRGCFVSLLGAYAMERDRLNQAVAAIQSGALQVEDREQRSDDVYKGYEVRDGVAEICVTGGITKRSSKFSTTDSQGLRAAIDAAVEDDDVRGLLLIIDSPGGQAAGVDEVGEAVRRAEKVKPTHAFVDDMAASAAYWIAAQAGMITVNRMGEVGSIGVYSVVYDKSEAFRRKGIKVHVVASGPAKGRGVPGTEIDHADLARVRERIEPFDRAFREAVAAGRGLSSDAVDAVATGDLFPAQRALDLGLVDAIGSYESARASLLDVVDAPQGSGERETPEAPKGVPTALLRRRLSLHERNRDAR